LLNKAIVDLFLPQTAKMVGLLQKTTQRGEIEL